MLESSDHMKYEVIVVGGGHAGCEACLASARKGHKTLLITGNIIIKTVIVQEVRHGTV